jgi:hypothetical protein
MDFKYFVIDEHGPKPGCKTPRYLVRNKSQDAILGIIKWYGAWRQFCFFPQPETVWSTGCLAGLQQAMGSIAARYKQQRDVKGPDFGQRELHDMQRARRRE